MSIQIQEVSKVYGSQRAVDRLSFEVKKGEILGFLGPNGAGKSTTLKMITASLVPTEGQISVCGYDTQTQAAQVRKLTGYLPEHNPLYLEMYVKEYLGFVAGLYGIRGKNKRISELIEICGLGREQHKRIGDLSKGYRQRVGFGQALMHDPEVLILDEPTTGFDPNQIVEIREVIREVGRSKTVIFSTHILSEVQALCDRVVIINQGKLVANDTVSSLYAPELTKNPQQYYHVSVQFQESEPSLKQHLAELSNVEAVDVQAEGRFLVSSLNEDPRVAIFNLATKLNNPLLEMGLKEQSLESVFQELTEQKTRNSGE